MAIVPAFPGTASELSPMRLNRKQSVLAIAALAAVLMATAGAYFTYFGSWPASELRDAARNAYAKETDAKTDATRTGGAGGSPAADSVDLTDSQLASVKVEPAGEYEFPIEKEAVGSIDFNQEMSVQVFTPYQGRIVGLFATVGDEVKKGQTLFTIDSPDLLQAESTLIASAGVLQLQTHNLERLRELYAALETKR